MTRSAEFNCKEVTKWSVSALNRCHITQTGSNVTAMVKCQSTEFQNVQARISDCQSTWSSVHHRALATFADHWSAQCTTIVSGVCPTLLTLPDHATSCLFGRVDFGLS